MDGKPTLASPESLLAHVEWVRRLARALVRPDEADDVVQQTYAQALEAPPPSRNLRGWLGAIARNVVRRGARDAATRSYHETRAFSFGYSFDPVELVARAELHRRVVEAVLALDEPYRSTLVMRFFDDQPADSIARAVGVPVETVRTRVKQGIARLRTRLEKAVGGDDAAGVAARALLFMRLGDLAHGPVSTGAAAGAAALAAGGVVMSIAMKCSIAAAAVAVVGLSVWFVRGGEGRRLDVGKATARVPQAAANAVELPPPQTASRATEPVAAAAGKLAKGDDTAAPGAPASDCSVHGVVRDALGRPAVGVSVMALIAPRYGRRAMEDLASIATHPGGTTDGEGHFTLAGLSDEDEWIVGACDGEGACAASDKFKFDEKQRSVERELKLVPLVELKGRVVDADGSPIGGTRVEVVSIWNGQRGDKQEFTTAFAGRDPGTWSTGRHPAEAFEVRVKAPRFFVDRKAPLHVDLPPGRLEAEIEIVLEAREGVPAKGPIVDESGRPLDLRQCMTKRFGDPLPDDREPWKLQVSALNEDAPAPEVGGLLQGECAVGRILFDEGSYEFRLPENFRGWLALTIDHRVVGTARFDSPATPPPLPLVALPPMVPPDWTLVIVTVVDGTTGTAIDARTVRVFVEVPRLTSKL